MKRRIVFIFSLVLIVLFISINISYGYVNNKKTIKISEYKNKLINTRIKNNTIIVEEEKDNKKDNTKKSKISNKKEIVEKQKEINNEQNVVVEDENNEQKVYDTNGLLNDAKAVVNNNSSLYNDVLNYVNEYRKEVGVESIALDNNLNLAATIRAMEMAYTNTFSHTRPNGTSCFTVLSELNITSSFYGENIAKGYRTPEKVANGWKSSEGHYKNMINERFTKIGIGYYKINNNIYWVQLFSS